MLKLRDIKKDYVMSDEIVHALKGVDVNFRRNEFVAILGPSGCGKTTLLNIIGGLDRYTSGDLIIEGKSTKNYNDRDWDTYRNHSIGFVFQAYNLIGHISVLANVELALTISGVSKQERRKRALTALETVGLKDKANKKPNQLSGGQMQRVAIARALVNNPEVLLADEPTGALDSKTSVQIMDLLKEVAKDRLVIMVTHNPDLAYEYANRIINMEDGILTFDSNPYNGETLEELNANKASKVKTINKGKKERSSMSFATSLGLSFRNLMAKKGRTFLVSFAASIGIIGIALILSVSDAFHNYIGDIQSNTLSSYPMTITKVSTPDLTSIFGGNGSTAGEKYPTSDEVSENSTVTNILEKLSNVSYNDTEMFKAYLEQPEVKKEYMKYCNSIEYTYDTELSFFTYRGFDGNIYDNYQRLMPINSSDMYMFDAKTYRTESGEPLSSEMNAQYQAYFPSVVRSIRSYFSSYGLNAFTQLIDNQDLINEQFDVIKGRMPQKYDEVVLRVDQYNRISDLFLFGLGIKDPSYMISQMAYALNNGIIEDLPKPAKATSFSGNLNDFLNLSFKIMTQNEMYDKIEDGSVSLGYKYRYDYNTEKRNLINDALEIKVVGIIRQKQGVTATSFSGAIGYSKALFDYLALQGENPTDLPYTNHQGIYDQLQNPDYNVLTGNAFDATKTESYANTLNTLGYVDETNPVRIIFYPKSFEAKNKIKELINEYNASVDEKYKITITDNIAVLMDSVQIIVDAVTYVLIAFVSISLVVSSIMIAIITYVSVLERTKEIGVLRSIGASKHNISSVFNAETLLTGLVAGALGVAVACVLVIPIMFFINSLADINLFIIVPWYGLIILPLISIALTLIAGLIPSRIAAKKDPVIALRSE